jgi:hypothetical protein
VLPGKSRDKHVGRVGEDSCGGAVPARADHDMPDASPRLVRRAWLPNATVALSAEDHVLTARTRWRPVSPSRREGRLRRTWSKRRMTKHQTHVRALGTRAVEPWVTRSPVARLLR